MHTDTSSLDVFREMPVPRYTMILLTKRCHHRCSFCSVAAPRNVDLDYGLLTNLLTELKSAGGEHVGFSGGEPFLYPDFFDAIIEARSLGLRVSVTTTGNFIDESNVGTIGLFIQDVGISLHGTPAKHNEMTKSKDGYTRVLRALDLLKRRAPNSTITLLHTVTQANFADDHLEHVLAVAEHHRCGVFVARAIRAGLCDEPQMLKPAELQQLVRRTYELQRAGRPVKLIECIPHCLISEDIRENARGCGAGIGFGCVDESGEVKICPQSNTSLGSVNKAGSFQSVWQGDAARKFRAGDWLSSGCKSCDLLSKCRSGCHVEVEQPGFASDFYLRLRHAASANA